MTDPLPSATASRPGLLVELGAALVALVLVGIAGGLGYWQYDAWQTRRTLEATDLTELTPVPLTEVMGGDDPFPARDLGRPVQVDGEHVFRKDVESPTGRGQGFSGNGV